MRLTDTKAWRYARYRRSALVVDIALHDEQRGLRRGEVGVGVRHAVNRGHGGEEVRPAPLRIPQRGGTHRVADAVDAFRVDGQLSGHLHDQIEANIEQL